MARSRVYASLNGRRIKNPVVRAMLAVLAVMIAIGLLGLVLVVALPVAVLAIGVAVVGSLAAAFIPRLRRRNRAEPETRIPRGTQGMAVSRGPVRAKRVEPIEPPRTVDEN